MQTMWGSSLTPFSIFLLVLAEVTASDATRPGDDLPPTPAPVSYGVRGTVVSLERSQVIPFHLEQPAARDATFETTTGDPSVLQVMRRAVVLEGETIGYTRVRGAGVGETELTIEGATLLVTVAQLRAEAPVQDRSPRIVVPAPDAVVWGEFAIAVESNLGVSKDAPRPPRVIVRLPNGTELDPVGVLPADGGPTERSVFTLDVSSFEPGPLELAVEARVEGEAPLHGDSVWVTVVHPRAEDVFVAECETFRWAERPEAFGTEEPRAGRGADASGGGFVVNTRTDPTWIVPVDVERDGSYQAMLVARGDLGAGALPSVGLVIDMPYEPVTNVRLADRRWRRVPLGPPLQLKAGRRTLGLRYLNDGPTSQLSDRALYLDRFELLRLDTLATGVDGSAASMMEEGGESMAPMASMASMESMVPDTSAEDSWLAAGPEGIRVAFQSVFDGLPLNGRINIQGRCVWNGASNNGPAPQVDLFVDGERFSTQQAAQPLFAFDRGALSEGEHTIQLVAWLPDGRSAATPVQVLRVDGRAEPQPARSLRRFSVLDDRWVDQFEGMLVTEEKLAGHRVALLDVNLEAQLELPKRFVGTYDILVEVRGSGQATGLATIEVVHATEGKETVVGSHDVRGWWEYGEIGTIDMTAGPDTLIVRVTHHEPSESKNGRTPVLRSLMLRERRERADRNAPRAEIMYPPAGHTASVVDAIVVHAFDEEDRLQQADVLLDGRPQGTFGYIPDAAGCVVLPLVLRDVRPGPHTVAVRVVDRSGNLGESREVPIVVEAGPSGEAAPRGQYARAVRMLDRFAFGPEPRELARILVEGESAWLTRCLAERGAGDEAALDAARIRLLNANAFQVQHTTLHHLVQTNNPARARFTLWLQNHFSTWIRKASPGPEWREYQALHELGPAPFSELLLASATSPAMLWYLDQSVSFAGRLNENYAREIMELHTVGVDGGYTQDEVTSLARLLCGMTVAEEAPPNGRGIGLSREFRFAADLCDVRSFDVLGMRFDRPSRDGSFDRILLALELLAAHPSTGRYVCREIAEHYVAVPAPDDLVEDLALVFASTGGDLLEVLLALSEHPRFWETPPRVATPVDYGLRLARSVENTAAIWSLGTFLNRSGMGLYDRATPDGYPEEDTAWIDSNATAQRWTLGAEVPWAIRVLVPDGMRRGNDGDELGWRQRLVDVTAIRLTGWPLGDASNEAALAFLEDVEGERWRKADQLAVLITRLPEASLR
jgi:hypothetical protein